MARRVLPDDHTAMIDLFLDLAIRQSPITGVVHVGAHRGQEVARYRAHGIERIVLIEANPAHCEYLRTAHEHDARISVMNYAIDERDGWVELHVNTSRSGNDESSSILPLGRLSEIVETVRTQKKVCVRARTLDSLQREGAFRGCSFLNIDIQGAELRALRGARMFLNELDTVLIETNLIEMYKGCALEPEIDAELAAHGFDCVERIYHELYEGERHFPAWGESLYVRGLANESG